MIILDKLCYFIGNLLSTNGKIFYVDREGFFYIDRNEKQYVTRDLVPYDASLIIIGRTNYDRQDSSENLIVIDNIFNKPEGNFKRYVNDVQTLVTRFTADFSIMFYGELALQNALTFQNMLISQLSFELQASLGITVYLTSTHNNLRIKDGTNYHELYQCDFKVRYDESTDVPTLSIDTAEVDFIFNE